MKQRAVCCFLLLLSLKKVELLAACELRFLVIGGIESDTRLTHANNSLAHVIGTSHGFPVTGLRFIVILSLALFVTRR